MTDSTLPTSTATTMPTDTFSSGNDETTTMQVVISYNSSLQSETTTRMPSTQESATTAIIASVIIIIVILMIILLVILMVLFRRSLCIRLLQSKSQHQSDWSRSNKHSEESNERLPNNTSCHTYDALHRSPKKKPVATNGIQGNSNSSEMYSVLDKSVKKNSEDGTSEGRYISDMYAAVDEIAKMDSAGIYEAPDAPSAPTVGNQNEQQKANNMYEAPDGPNLSEMYALVNKTAKNNGEGSIESLNSPNIAEMYAVVDKTAKKRHQ